jgi:hypothetical protein
MKHLLATRWLGGLMIAGVTGISLLGAGTSSATAAPYWYHRHFYPGRSTVGIYPTYSYYQPAYTPGYATYPAPYSAYYDAYPGYYGGYVSVSPGYWGRGYGYWGGRGYWGGGHGYWRGGHGYAHGHVRR